MSETEDYPNNVSQVEEASAAPLAPEKPNPFDEELPVAEVFHPGLRRGDTDRGVFDLQLRLGCAGTGVFDEATEYAVKSMQTAGGMMVDGVAGEAIHGRLNLPWPPAS